MCVHKCTKVRDIRRVSYNMRQRSTRERRHIAGSSGAKLSTQMRWNLRTDRARIPVTSKAASYEVFADIACRRPTYPFTFVHSQHGVRLTR
eukprot:3951833-Heterocapsa_arctica.AAC.1